jgi:hypothetical protein
MPRPLARSLLVVLPLSAGLAVGTASPGFAHETRTGGALRFVVGWGDEPAYTGFKNSVQVTIGEAGGGGVTDVVDTLKVEVTKGEDKMTAPLVANFRPGAFGTPGDYRAWITPTRPGAYTFRITGTIRGQNVDETFSSGRNTFNDVEDVSAIQFPAKDPTTGQLATRVDREFPRLDAAVQDAEDQAGTARTLALAGVAVGALGLLAAAGALFVARRSGVAGTSARRDDEAVPRAGQPESLSR